MLPRALAIAPDELVALGDAHARATGCPMQVQFLSWKVTAIKSHARANSDRNSTALDLSFTSTGSRPPADIRERPLRAEPSLRSSAACLDVGGGGAKGFYTLGVLCELEVMARKPFCECL